MAITMGTVNTDHFDGHKNLTPGQRYDSDATLEELLIAARVDLSSQDARITVVEGLTAGMDLKASVDLCTAAVLNAYTAAGSGVGKTLTQNAAAIESIDGVALSVGDRILVNDTGSATAADRGIYTVTTVGTGAVEQVLTRATDFDEDDEVSANAFVWVERGTALGDTAWVLTTNDPIVVDTTGLSFSQFTASAHALSHERGGDLEIDGDHLDIDFTPSNYDPSTTPAEAANVDDLAAHLAGIDDALGGITMKRTVRLATAGALAAYTQAGAGAGATLTANAVGVENIDGVAVVLNDRVLVNDLGTVTGADRGIYTVTTVGTGGAAQVLTRAAESDEDSEVFSGLEVNVAEGTANAGSKYVLTTADPIVVDTTAVSFEQRGLYAPVGDITTVDAGDADAAGTADTYARGDHEHGVSTAAAGAIQIGDAAAEGAATDLARSDHTHSLAAPAAPEDISGAAATGAGTAAARADHVHKLEHFATFVASDGTATGAGNAAAANTINAHNVYDFDDGGAVADEQIAFEGVVPDHYSGGDLTVKLYWAGAANVGDVKWDVSWERIELNTLDIDAGDSYAAAQTVTDTAPATVGFVTDVDITFTLAQADGIIAGDPFRLLVMRDSNDVADTMVGDASLLAVKVSQ